VASTKAFTCQIAALYVLAIHLGQVRGTLAPAEAVRRVEDLLLVPDAWRKCWRARRKLRRSR